MVHIHIDRVGTFLETDEYYRSQFETGTSSGALDGKNAIRKRWEMELFGGTYEDAKPFERCKYGALGVMNDFRGVTSAYGYGDSYLARPKETLPKVKKPIGSTRNGHLRHLDVPF